MTADTDKKYMNAAYRIDRDISDESVRRVYQKQIEKNLEAQMNEPILSDSAEDYKSLDEETIPYRDLIQNNAVDWDEFVEDHLSHYPDFKNWVRNFTFKGQAPVEPLKRIIERAIKDME